MLKIKHVEDTILEIDGIDEKNFTKIKFILTRSFLYIVQENKRKKQYSLTSIQSVKADSSRIWISIEDVKYSLLIIDSDKSSKEKIISFENELNRNINKTVLETKSNLQGASKNKKKKYNKVYRRKVFLVSIIVALFTLVLTIGFVSLSNWISTKKNKIPVVEDSLVSSINQQDFIESSVDALINTKSYMTAIEEMITNEIMLKNENTSTWMRELNEIQNNYESSKITDFTYDHNYKKLNDNFIKDATENIYSLVDNVIERTIDSLNNNDELSNYLDILQNIDFVNMRIDEAIRNILTEKV